MRVLLFLALLGCTLAAPQDFLGNPTDDGTDDSDQSSDTPFFLFPPLFRDFPAFPSFPSQSPDFDDTFPEFPEDLPNANTTYEVKEVNGSRVEVNRTVSTQTDENGNTFHTHVVHTIVRYPEYEDGQGNSTEAATEASSTAAVTEDPAVPDEPLGGLPEGNDGENQVEPYEDFGVQVQPEHREERARRWILSSWITDLLRKTTLPNAHFAKPVPRPPASILPGVTRPTTHSQPRDESLIPIRNEDDIAVNYIGRLPRPLNLDAEVFDHDLVRENELRFREGRAQPVMVSQPLGARRRVASQPVRYQPIRSQPIVGQPIRTQPR